MSAGHDLPPVDPADLEAVTRQLGREVRGVAEVAHRCPCGEPDVVRTEPWIVQHATRSQSRELRLVLPEGLRVAGEARVLVSVLPTRTSSPAP